ITAIFIHANTPMTPVTITGLSVNNKVYDGTTTATVSGTPVINGLVAGDRVTVDTGTAAFTDANAGADKTVIFKDWSLSGADAGKYILSAQPASVKASIAKAQGSDVTVPTLKGTPTGKTITVNNVSLLTPATGQSIEYAISMASNGTGLSPWQSGVTFSGLTELTTYYVYARSASNINYEAGRISSASAGIATGVTTGFIVTFESNGG
ncbi:YDG domain-containing protein, partial [Treponema sp. R6D11]